MNELFKDQNLLGEVFIFERRANGAMIEIQRSDHDYANWEFSEDSLEEFRAWLAPVASDDILRELVRALYADPPPPSWVGRHAELIQRANAALERNANTESKFGGRL